MVPVLHAGTPHRVSLRGFERSQSHPQAQLVCVLIREMGSEARAPGRSRPLRRFGRAPAHVPAQLNVGT
jgi:hypothetical protein